VGGRKLSDCGREGGSYLTVGGRELSDCGREGTYPGVGFLSSNSIG